MNNDKFLNRILNSVKKYDNRAEIILFGSRARGDFKNDSDWDLLILLSKKADEKLKEKIRDELFEIELETDEVISSIIQSRKDWINQQVTTLYQNIQQEGMRL